MNTTAKAQIGEKKRNSIAIAIIGEYDKFSNGLQQTYLDTNSGSDSVIMH